MLFDLRGRGRRNVIKVIYVFLALLLGGGLVFFGIGGNTGSGGLVDAFTDGGGETGEGDLDKQIADARARIQSNPNDEMAYGDLIRAQVSRASTGDKVDLETETYNEEGLADLRAATESWTAYQEIDPSNVEEEASIASRIVQAYVELQDLEGLVGAQEIVAENRESVGTYAALAQYAYAAGQTRKGDLAGERALALEDADQRDVLRTQLDSYKAQSPAATAPPVPSAEPSAGPTGKKGKTGGKATPKQKPKDKNK